MPVLRFDNRFVRELPADPSRDPRPRQVFGAAYSLVDPTPVAEPRLLAHSAEVAAELGLDGAAVRAPDFAAAFGGNRLLPGMQGYAACYGGHQFGHWAGQLGDGRAIGLGEAVGVDGRTRELQLKGAGPTPYSRRADGRAVLRSSIREFLCSEAMHHLGVPTTRALSLVTTGEDVVRDMFYDGRAEAEPGAVVCRVAPSFLRLGSYQLPAARGERELLERLLRFTLDFLFPELEGPDERRRADCFAEVCRRTAVTVAHWMRVGFVHGVMNTDNLSVLGLTIDYGPYGWIDDFDLDWTPNTTDAGTRRYRFGQQPAVAHWNLQQFAAALDGLVEPAALEAGLGVYVDTFRASWQRMCGEKLGLPDFGPADEPLLGELFGMLRGAEVDMTLFFRGLGRVDLEDIDLQPLRGAFYDDVKFEAAAATFAAWLGRYAGRVRATGPDAAERRAIMDAANPRFVLRNYLAQEAIELATAGDPTRIAELLEAARRPYDDEPAADRFCALRPEWARHKPGCSMLSCSS
jgi:uncharacterized protein YdiU (UPF0061 family)